jgi:hypothetical protein
MWSSWAWNGDSGALNSVHWMWIMWFLSSMEGHRNQQKNLYCFKAWIRICKIQRLFICQVIYLCDLWLALQGWLYSLAWLSNKRALTRCPTKLTLWEYPKVFILF